MIVSHRHRFIFIKTLKTAGTSLEVYLSQHCGPDDTLTPVVPPEPGHDARNHRGVFNPFPAFKHAGRNRIPSRRRTARHLMRRVRFYNHMPAVLVRQRLPREIWEGYFKFCVDREPFDKTASLLRMLRQRGRVETLEELIAKGLLPSDRERYCDFDGAPLVDRILRYEDLDTELADIFAALGVPFPGSLGTRAKAARAPRQRRAQAPVTGVEAAAIERAFAWEFAELYPGASRPA